MPAGYSLDKIFRKTMVSLKEGERIYVKDLSCNLKAEGLWTMEMCGFARHNQVTVSFFQLGFVKTQIRNIKALGPFFESIPRYAGMRNDDTEFFGVGRITNHNEFEAARLKAFFPVMIEGCRELLPKPKESIDEFIDLGMMNRTCGDRDDL